MSFSPVSQARAAEHSLHHVAPVRWRHRLALPGVAVALLSVVVASWWGLQAGRQAAADADRAAVLAEHYRDARDGLLRQEVLRHHALVEGVTDDVVRDNDSLELDVAAALAAIRQSEDADHADHVRHLGAEIDDYTAAVRELLDAPADAGAGARADAAVVDLERDLQHEAEEHDEQARAALAVVAERQRTAVLVNAAVSALSLVLLLGSWRVLRAQRLALATQAARMHDAALHDALTGLGNRSMLAVRLARALEQRRPGREVALLLIDLDRFKEINDTLGHHYGDRLLQRIGPRLQPLLRQYDTVARLGGDEFAVLLPDVDGPGTAEDVAQRLQQAILEPFELDGVALSVEASVGVALSGSRGADADTLLQRADIAMYAAKRRAGGVRVFEDHMDTHRPERLTLLSELRLALQRKELVLHFQPKVALRSGDPVGMEALVRWQHPDRGLLMPDEFIALAEGTGLIEPLTRYVLDAALGQCARWRAEGHHDLVVAVNVSARNLVDDDLVGEVARLLARHRVPASCLVLEVTESAVMADPVKAGEILLRLHDLGVAVALDDFGAGYTSLAQLRNLPLSELKIDRQFVTALGHRTDDEMIVRSIVELGHNLGLALVAEGVEDADAARRLVAAGCETAQGYHFARPIPGALLSDWLGSHRHVPRPRAGDHPSGHPRAEVAGDSAPATG